MPQHRRTSLPFEVFEKELEEIRARRVVVGSEPPKAQDEIGPSPRRGLAGLAISGGGIRSSTLSLGVVQALSRAGLFARFDYLSTVSGGGYTGPC